MIFFYPHLRQGFPLQSYHHVHAAAVIVALVFLLVPSSSLAGGIFHFLPCYEDGHPVPLERAIVVSSKTRVVVSDTELEYVIDQTFLNNNDQMLEGVFMLPYEAEFPPQQASVTINGAASAPEMLSPDQSLDLLFQLTREMEEPSLLELAGKGVFVVRHLRLAPKKEKSIQVRLLVRKKVSDDLLEVSVPQWGERFSLGPVAGFEILVRFKMSVPVRAVFSPTHEVSILREAPHRATVSFRSLNKPVKQDLVVFATLRGTAFDARIFCKRTTEGDGFFMAILLNPFSDRRLKARPKDVVFALDVSGSISPVMRQASQRVVVTGIQRLGGEDRFNVVSIGTRIGAMHKGLLPASQENMTEAVRYLNSLEYGGGTDLFNGIMVSLEQFSASKRQRYVVLLTDGSPTVGNVDRQTFTEAVEKANRYGARIFSIGLGNGADTALLWQLSQVTRGSTIQVNGVGPFEGEINKFYEGITHPSVTDTSMYFENAIQVDSIPSTVPDMSGESATFVLGTYEQDKSAPFNVTVKARVSGRGNVISRSCDSGAPDQIKAYIPLIYAMRKAAKLMENERMKGLQQGESEALRFLSEKYGFKQPGTGRYPGREWGQLYWLYQTSLVPSLVESEDFRRIGGKLFRREGAAWVDTNFRPDFSTKTVRFLSDDYFDLVKNSPRLGQYLCLGQNVTIALDANAVTVLSEGSATNTSGDHEALVK